MWKNALLGVLLALAGWTASAKDERVEAVVKQQRGVDPQVDYASLLAIGPWDDRNYLLTKADLALLGPYEASITEPLPAFFRVALRKANPKMPRDSDVPYPLSAVNGFNILHGGYQYEGKLYERLSRVDGNRYVYIEGEEEPEAEIDPLRSLDGEVRISTPFGGAESAIAINPVNPNLMIAGSNGPSPTGDNVIRQKMWRSTDGGSTWTRSLPLSTTAGGNVCCDPTVAWSTDGSKAYSSALINCGTGCGIRFYRSDDFGVTWGDNDPGTSAPPPVDLAVGTADKQFIHVDAAGSSPHKDVVHICYHESNVNKYQRSTNFGVSFGPKITVDAAGRGVGCDLTTDRAGNVYYFYPGLDSGGTGTTRQIRVVKSSDGGVTFGAAVNAGATNDSFNYALPSMETRKVAKIVQADADISTGPYSNSVYVIWPDLNGPEDAAVAANNHSQIKVAYSRDGGLTWNTSIPHETADVLTVDRYQPSIKVDDLGRVHVIFYDTRHSTNRNGVDVYYNFSVDGAQTWSIPRRITTVTSVNINDNFEFGDYSHMDGVLDQIAAIFTDNRAETTGGAADKDVYGAQGFAEPFSPTYVQSAAASIQQVCAGNQIEPVSLRIRSVQEYASPVSLSTPALPASIVDAQFSVNPVIPSAAGTISQFNARVAASTSAGPVNFLIRGTSSDETPIIRETPVQLTVQNPLSALVELQSPADNATSISTTAVLTWSALAGATGYTVQLANNPEFTNPTEFTTSGLSFAISTPLLPDAVYYWRVKANNSCGSNAFSAARQFRTVLEFCVSPALAIPDNNLTGVSSTLSVPPIILGAITDLNVKVRLTHSFIGDLRLSLTDGSGTPVVRLINNPTACSGDNMDTSFDDEGAVFACTNANVPAVGAGPFRSLDLLSGFDSRPISGNWRLAVVDSAGTDIGTLDRWCLVPSGNFSSEGLLRDGFE